MIFAEWSSSWLGTEKKEAQWLLSRTQVVIAQASSVTAGKQCAISSQRTLHKTLLQRCHAESCPCSSIEPQLVPGPQGGLHLHLQAHHPLPWQVTRPGPQGVSSPSEGGVDQGGSSLLPRLPHPQKYNQLLPHKSSSICKSGFCLQKQTGGQILVSRWRLFL